MLANKVCLRHNTFLEFEILSDNEDEDDDTLQMEECFLGWNISIYLEYSAYLYLK